jgi:hypothetical protein
VNNFTRHFVEAISQCQSLFESALRSRLASPFLKSLPQVAGGEKLGRHQILNNNNPPTRRTVFSSITRSSLACASLRISQQSRHN